LLAVPFPAVGPFGDSPAVHSVLFAAMARSRLSGTAGPVA
jgi:hypothetical protein